MAKQGHPQPKKTYDLVELFCKTGLDTLDGNFNAKLWYREGDNSTLITPGTVPDLFFARYDNELNGEGVYKTTSLDANFDSQTVTIDPAHWLFLTDVVAADVAGVDYRYVAAVDFWGCIYFEDPTRIVYSGANQDAGKIFIRCLGDSKYTLLGEWLDEVATGVTVKHPAGCYEIYIQMADDIVGGVAGGWIPNDDGTFTAYPSSNFGTSCAGIEEKQVCAYLCRETGEYRLGSTEGEVIELDTLVDGTIYSKSPLHTALEASNV